MPKLKTHRGAAKRFKKTATGKFVRSKAFKRHILTSKTRSRKRGLKGTVVVSKADQATAAQDAAVRVSSRSRDAEAVTEDQTAMPESKEETSGARSGRSCSHAPRVLPDQEQAVSLRQGVGRHGAQVRVRRPPPQEARLPPPVGHAHQRRGARERADLRSAHRRPEGGGQHDRPEDPRRPRRDAAGGVRAAGEGRGRREAADDQAGRAGLAKAARPKARAAAAARA